MIYRNIENNKGKIKKPVIPLIMLFATILIGTLGYNVIWADKGASFVDSLYMTMITITTIGYTEVYKLDQTGRLFTIFIGIVGIGSLFYLLGIVMENLFTIQILNLRGQKKMKKKIEELENHIIIVGYGRVGNLTAQELKNQNQDFLVIDKEFEDDDELSGDNIIAFEADATDDEVLKEAGIERAKSIIVSTANPTTTLFVVLSAREMHPGLFIVARSDSREIESKLVRAGADRIINPYSAGGQKMANIAINPQIMEFIDSSLSTVKGDTLKFEQFLLKEDSDMNGKSLKDLDIRNRTGVTVIGIVRDKKTIINPEGDFSIESGDQLITLGTRSQLDKFNEICDF